MTIRHGLPTLLAAGAAALLLAACGSGSGDDDAAAGEPDDTKQLAFARCMREAGIDFKDPSGEGRAMQVKIPKGISPQRLQVIQRDCAKKTGGGPKEPSKEEQAKFRDAALKFARCMRAHGVDIPDPQAGGGGIMIRKRAGGGGGADSSGPDPESPAFQRAQKACSKLLPGGGPKGGTVNKSTDSGSGPSNEAVIGEAP